MSFDFQHDRQARCFYAKIEGATVKTSREVLGGHVIADFDADGQPVGLRILYDNANDFLEKIDSTPDEAWPPGLWGAINMRLTTIILVEMRDA